MCACVCVCVCVRVGSWLMSMVVGGAGEQMFRWTEEEPLASYVACEIESSVDVSRLRAWQTTKGR